MTTKLQRQLIKKRVFQPDPIERGSVGFSTRLICQVTLPYSEPGPGVEVWARRSGLVSIEIEPWREYDESAKTTLLKFPYGSIPRLALLWLFSEVVKTRDRKVLLGDNIWGFLESIGFTKQACNYQRLHDQLLRLFNCHIRFSCNGERGFLGPIVQNYGLWWKDNKENFNPKELPPYVNLSPVLFDDLMIRGFPVDLDIVKGLHKKIMALDLYQWFSYLVFQINQQGEPRIQPWETLYEQFGGGLDMKNFKARLKGHVDSVRVYWPNLKILFDEIGATISPSPLTVEPYRRQSIAPSAC